MTSIRKTQKLLDAISAPNKTNRSFFQKKTQTNRSSVHSIKYKSVDGGLKLYDFSFDKINIVMIQLYYKVFF